MRKCLPPLLLLHHGMPTHQTAQAPPATDPPRHTPRHADQHVTTLALSQRHPQALERLEELHHRTRHPRTAAAKVLVQSASTVLARIESAKRAAT